MNVINMKISIDMGFPYVKLIVISGKEISMKDRCYMRMISVIKNRVVVIIDIVVLRLLGGLVIMETC